MTARTISKSTKLSNVCYDIRGPIMDRARHVCEFEGCRARHRELGYWRGELELTDRAKRRKYGLPELPRMAKLEDDSARAHHYLRQN